MTNKTLASIDVAQTQILDSVRLDRVGMSKIECPVLVSLDSATMVRAPALVDAYVSLDQPQKGIHMSRLFLVVEKHLESGPVCPDLLQSLVNEFLVTHSGISQSAYVRVGFDLMIKRPALLSQNSGWRSYPVSLWASIGKSSRVGADVTMRYSSTCPCSAALSRQLIQSQFDKDFDPMSPLEARDVRSWLGTEGAIAGTPHGQRSEGKILTELNAVPKDLGFLVQMINSLESSLTTPVQAAVKREDEQEFARLNAANLMFAEDACRRMHRTLATLGIFKGTSVEARHIESLHPHDAVAIVTSGTLSQN
ncbi:MAG: GTP cyclohydrolase FolE2 [Proteobacteria bacterium]|nr:GTP cyclohydrolase FolE2 [Pseudomonadota bacterium]